MSELTIMKASKGKLRRRRRREIIIQWYKVEKVACVFRGESSMLAELPDCDTKESADESLHDLGSRRRGKWRRTSWGYEARIRRI